jgi:hypothetical protein
MREHQRLEFEDPKIELAVLTPKGIWKARNLKSKGIPVILDVVDANNLLDSFGFDVIRGLSLYSKNANGTLLPRRMSKILREGLKYIDLVVVANREQECLYSDQVPTTPILDSHEEIPFVQTELREPGQLLWEGLPYTWDEVFPIFSRICGAVPQNSAPSLNLITSEKYRSLKSFSTYKDSKEFIERKKREYGNAMTFLPWSITNLVESARLSECGLLPLSRNKNSWLKAENRLLIMWKLGLPVLFSNTPAYTRVAQISGATNGSCENSDDWAEKFSLWRSRPDLAQKEVDLGRAYITKYHSDELFLSKWDSIIYSMLAIGSRKVN